MGIFLAFLAKRCVSEAGSALGKGEIVSHEKNRRKIILTKFAIKVEKWRII